MRSGSISIEALRNIVPEILDITDPEPRTDPDAAASETTVLMMVYLAVVGVTALLSFVLTPMARMLGVRARVYTNPQTRYAP